MNLTTRFANFQLAVTRSEIFGLFVILPEAEEVLAALAIFANRSLMDLSFVSPIAMDLSFVSPFVILLYFGSLFARCFEIVGNFGSCRY